MTANVSPTQYFKLIGVVDAIPIVGRFIIKYELQTNQHFYSSFRLGDKVYIELDETEIDLSKVTPKLPYKNLKLNNKLLPLLKTR